MGPRRTWWQRPCGPISIQRTWPSFIQLRVTYILKKNGIELVSNFDAEKYFAQYLLLGTNAFSQTHQDYLKHSAEQRDWLRDHP